MENLEGGDDGVDGASFRQFIKVLHDLLPVRLSSPVPRLFVEEFFEKFLKNLL